MELKLRTKKRIYRWTFEIIKKPVAWTTGTMNRTQDGKYVVYGDYDLIEEDYLLGEILHFQNLMDWGNVHVFQSSPKKYHIICCSKLTAREYVTYLENSSVDETFKKVPRYISYRNWVLRHFGKADKPAPTYLFSINRKTQRMQSHAHHEFLKKLYPNVDFGELENSDGTVELDMIKYKTGNV